MKKSPNKITIQKSNEKLCPFGREMNTYWKRRYDLFSQWDSGIQVDKQGLYTVKPEKIAIGIAKEIKGQVVLDALCGPGGITTALVRSGHDVIAVDIDKNRLDMTKNNVNIYVTDERVKFIHANIFDVLKEVKADCIVLDPDWGGPNYKAKKYTRLFDFTPNGHDILKASLKVTENVVLCTPANFDFKELDYLPYRFETKKWVMWDRIICYTVKFGQ